MRHFRKTIQSYKSYNAEDKLAVGCTFCSDNNIPRVISENDTMFVMSNRVSYDMFAGQRVASHLMVISKRHVETLKDFTKNEKLDYMEIISEYEAQGYDIYARGVGSIARSVKHQHTHLIKLVKRSPNVFFFIQKPYFLISW